MNLSPFRSYISAYFLANRPKYVWIISTFYWLNALLFGAIGIPIILILFGIFPNEGGDKPDNFLLTFSLAIGAIVLAIALIIVGWNLWKLKPQARLAGITLSGLILVINLIIFGVRLVNGQFSIPFSVIFHGIVIGALYNRSIKVAFQDNSQ